MNKNLIIDARFSEPPSECIVFRDVSLYASMFLQLSVLVECKKKDEDLYWYWLKRNGSFDFIEDFVEPDSETGIVLSYLRGNISVQMLTAETLNFVINQLVRLTK